MILISYPVFQYFFVVVGVNIYARCYLHGSLYKSKCIVILADGKH